MKGCRPLTQVEIQAVAEQLHAHDDLGARNGALFALGLNTGFRVSELLSIRVGDVQQNGSMVQALEIRRCKMKGKGEGRTVHLNSKAKLAITTWLASLKEWGCQADTPLFCSRARKELSRVQVWRMFDQAFGAIGLTGTLGTHCMRKTYAMRMHELLKGDLKQLQGALGHKWITSTAQYLSFKEDLINSAIDNL